MALLSKVSLTMKIVLQRVRSKSASVTDSVAYGDYHFAVPFECLISLSGVLDLNYTWSVSEHIERTIQIWTPWKVSHPGLHI